MDRREIMVKINTLWNTVKANRLPTVYLCHGELTDEEIQLMRSDLRADVGEDGKVGVNYNHATHAKLNSIIEAIKTKNKIK